MKREPLQQFVNIQTKSASFIHHKPLTMQSICAECR